MNYSIEDLETTEECDQLLEVLTREKDNFDYKLIQENRQYGSIANGTQTVESSIAAVDAEIAGLEAAIAAMPPGDSRDALVVKVTRLGHRKYNLEQRMDRFSTVAKIEQQFDVSSMELLKAEIEALIASVNQKKEELLG